MRRRTFDALMATGGLVLAVVLVIAGSLLLWGHSFAATSLQNQLASQKIYFPPNNSPAIAAPQFAAMHQYAGQEMTTGAQAEVYADHFIGNHLREIAGGKTYSQVSSEVQALAKSNPTSPQLAKLQGEEQTLFQGTTLRGLLLNAYAFGKLGQIAFVAAWVAFAGAAVMLLLSVLGYAHLRRVSPEVEVLPRLGSPTPTPVG